MRRLFSITVAALAVALFGLVAGGILGAPFLERRLERALAREVGAPVTVDVRYDKVPGIFAGDVGDVTVEAASLKRDGLQLRDLQVRLVGADITVHALVRGDIEVAFDRIAVTTAIDEASLQDYLAPILATAGIPGAEGLRVQITRRGAIATLGGVTVPFVVRVTGPRRILVEPQGESQQAVALRRVLADPIDVGELPFGLRLRSVRYQADRVIVVGGRDAGRIRFD